MEQHDISVPFETGAVPFPGLEVRAIVKPGFSHPAWNGVFLTDLVTAKETGGAFSCHLVRDPRTCEVADHDHESPWERNAAPGGHRLAPR